MAASDIHMVTGSDTPTQTDDHTPIEFKLGVRMTLSHNLEGIALREDGLMFRSENAISVGTNIELVLCSGSILVDATVQLCQPQAGQKDGFIIHVKYMDITPQVAKLINEDIRAGSSIISRESDKVSADIEEMEALVNG